MQFVNPKYKMMIFMQSKALFRVQSGLVAPLRASRATEVAKKIPAHCPWALSERRFLAVNVTFATDANGKNEKEERGLPFPDLPSVGDADDDEPRKYPTNPAEPDNPMPDDLPENHPDKVIFCAESIQTSF